MFPFEADHPQLLKNAGILANLAIFCAKTKKGELTFSDIMALVRRSIWSSKYFSKSENQVDLDKYPEETINTLIYQLSLAA